MAVIEGAVSGNLQEVGAANAAAAHTVNKPTDAGSLGHYAVSVATGAIAAGMTSNGELFQFRWSDSTRLAQVTEIRLTGMRATTAFAAGAVDIKLTPARAWTVNGTGGTALTLTGDQMQLRTSFATTLVGDIRIATTAALGAGTKTLDTQDTALIVTHSSAGFVGATPIIGQIFLPEFILFKANVANGEHPIILAQNEGFVVRATVPATGVWNLGVAIKWAELANY